MAVLRRDNILSGLRMDSPDLKALESSASNDFDQLIQSLITAAGDGFVLRGFDIGMANAIGGAASSLVVNVSGASVLHPTASQSGTFFVVPTGTSAQVLNSATNTQVSGAFSPNAINYVGLDYTRAVDDTTSATRYIWDPSSSSETTITAPTAIIMNYKFVITSTTWASNILPLAVVKTDAGNNVVSIEDARSSLFRLGTAGRSTPNPFYVYPWTAQSEGRVENPFISTSNSVNPFHGGDKMLGSFKDWMDAVMSSLLEIKGTTYWYSSNAGGSLTLLRQDVGNTVITGQGLIEHSGVTPGLINWTSDIYMRIVGSQLSYKLVSNPSSTDITLADNEVAYITLTRDASITPNLIFTNGSAVVSSVGAVAWTTNLVAGDYIKKSSDTAAGYYLIQSVDSVSQVTLAISYAGSSTGSSGTQAQYAYGVYQNSPAPSTPRNIYLVDRASVPAGQDIFWLFLRSDNGGVTPNVYVRFLGADLQFGESSTISSDFPLQVLTYIGSPLETATKPEYVAALNPGSIPEITSIVNGDASTISSNQYFLINSSGNWRQYYAWFNKDGTGIDPAVTAKTGIQITISTGQSAGQVSTAIANALNATAAGDFSAVASAGSVAVTNVSAGATTAASNHNVGAPFSVSITQAGTGVGSQNIQDGDNLTLAIKKLDKAITDIAVVASGVGYDELVDIVASGATPPTSLNAPVTSGTSIQLPLNSRLGYAAQTYTVGNGLLQLNLNGQRLAVGRDWNEVGATGTNSSHIIILSNLVAGDTLKFEILSTGVSGVPGPAGPPGPTGATGSDAVGGPISISTKNSDYTVLSTDNVLKANCSGGTVTFFLPPAATATGRVFWFKKVDATANAMILQGNGIDNIDGFNTFSVSVQYSSVILVTDGSEWSVF